MHERQLCSLSAILSLILHNARTLVPLCMLVLWGEVVCIRVHLLLNPEQQMWYM